MADLEAEGREDATLDARGIHRRKTGALLRAALRMGAAVAHAPGQWSKRIDTYGRARGLGASRSSTTCWTCRGDEAKWESGFTRIRHGKWTYPGLLGLERARRLAAEAVAALDPLGDRAERLRVLASYLLERDS